MTRLAAGIVWLTVMLLSLPVAAGQLDAILYKDPQCGCCGKYVEHLKAAGIRVDVRNADDIYALKPVYGVPESLYSCHTMMIDGYVVEGHVPLTVLGKLLAERPDIAGIALPGMPSGSPGMPGPKDESFTIYGFSSGVAPTVYVVE
jgi:hypothetical protein